MIDTALVIVRLRWALTLAALRKSVWQTIGYVISLLLGAGFVVGAGLLAWSIGGSGSGRQAGHGLQAVLPFIVVIVGAFITVLIGFIQITLVGEGSSMSPQRFALYGIEDHRLQTGLLLGGLSGIPAVSGLIAMMLWSSAYRWMGAAVVVCAIVAAPLVIVTMMSFSKLVVALATTLVTSKRGKNAFYVVATMAFIGATQLPSLVLNSQDVSSLSVDELAKVSRILAWTPFGAAFRLPFDVYAGDWLALVARVVIVAATWVACFMVCTWCLRHERLIVGAHAQTTRERGIGVFSTMPDSISGAVSARLITYLRRDPRQMLAFLMPLLFLVLFTLQSHGNKGLVWQAPILSALFFNIAESNGLAYDGRGFTMQAMIGVAGRDDRRGRVRVYAWIIGIYLLLMGLAVFVITGDWRTPGGLRTGVICLGVSFALSYSALGLAQITSCTLMYPVASLDKPFSSPQGRALAKTFMPFAYMIGMGVLIAPTGLVALILALARSDAMWLIGPVGIVNGVVMLVLGSWLGGKVMDARLLGIVRTLDGFASLQK